MAALDEMNLSTVATTPTTEDALKAIINEKFWQWFTLHQNDKVFKVKWWVVSKTVYVHDLRSIFELLVGSNPRY